MHLLLLSMAFFVAQMNTLHKMPVVHLGPHSDVVQVGYGGKLLELINAPAKLALTF